MSADARVKTAQRANERVVLRLVRDGERRGRPWHPSNSILPTALWNALDRLVAAGRVRFERAAGGYRMGV